VATLSQYLQPYIYDIANTRLGTSNHLLDLRVCFSIRTLQNHEGIQTKQITFKLPQPYLEALDTLVHDGMYPTRAEAIRTAIRDFIQSKSINTTKWYIPHRG